MWLRGGGEQGSLEALSNCHVRVVIGPRACIKRLKNVEHDVLISCKVYNRRPEVGLLLTGEWRDWLIPGMAQP